MLTYQQKQVTQYTITSTDTNMDTMIVSVTHPNKEAPNSFLLSVVHGPLSYSYYWGQPGEQGPLAFVAGCDDGYLLKNFFGRPSFWYREDQREAVTGYLSRCWDADLITEEQFDYLMDMFNQLTSYGTPYPLWDFVNSNEIAREYEHVIVEQVEGEPDPSDFFNPSNWMGYAPAQIRSVKILREFAKLHTEK